jgi:hypothetical protein
MNQTPGENEKDRRIRELEQLVQERTAQLSGAREQLEQSYDDTLEALSSALELRHAETRGHCQRVTAIHDLYRQDRPRFRQLSPHPRSRRLPPRHRQNGHPRLHPPQARSAER